MKKITAIVLALVMVFAFVGSASALTNREPLDLTTTAAAVPGIDLDLQIISTIIGLPTAGSIINWATFNAENNVYFEGGVVYFNAQIIADGYVPYYTTTGFPPVAGPGAALAANATAGKQIWDTINAYGLKLIVESEGVNFSLATLTYMLNTKTNTTPAYDVTAPMTATTAANATRAAGSVTVQWPASAVASLNFYKFNILFDGIVTAQNPVVNAKLVAGPGLDAFPRNWNPSNTSYPVYGDPTSSAANAPFAQYFNVAKYRNAQTGKGDALYMVIYKNEIAAVKAADDSAAPTVRADGTIIFDFDLQENGTLKELVLNFGGNKYRVLLSSAQAGSNQRWAFESKDAAPALTDAQIKALNVLVNAVFAQFGFSYDLNGRIIDRDFIAHANFVAEDSVVVKTAVASIDVDDGDDVPVTGDVASTFGFVMIAVAIIATASLAIVAKKAR